MPSIRLVSINIERSKHLDTVSEFLRKQSADVVTLQEVMERDLLFLESVLGMKSFYVPLSEYEKPDEAKGLEGQSIFARDFVGTSKAYYAGEWDPLTKFTEDKLESIVRIAKALSWVQVEKAGQLFCVATTHFTWSEHGEVTDLQRKDMQALLEHLKGIPEFVLSGDFNTPRGREMWDLLAATYKDNIPLKYSSSIDPLLHRAAPIPYVIDGVFTTLGYSASNVELHTGISDHCAVTATISKLS
jgi:endonuclease/exonuclease/phosphatase family metal-dependent hydrolase